jgi:hypothetical protein
VNRKLALGIAVLGLVGGTAGAAMAEPGPNGNNNHGLCTAYFAGSENGRAHKHKAPPFAALEQAARDSGYQDDGETIEKAVADYCEANGAKKNNGGGGGGGGGTS